MGEFAFLLAAEMQVGVASARSRAEAAATQDVSNAFAASTQLKSKVASDQDDVLKKAQANLDDATKAVDRAAAWITGEVQAETQRNLQFVQSLGSKKASGDYDPDLLFETPNAPLAASPDQASANLGNGSPSHGWNPGAYVGYYGDWGLYGWYGVGPWNEGATTVSPDGALIGAYSWSYGYGDGYSALLGNWDPWYGDGWYGWVDVAASYGDFNYGSLTALAPDPGHVADEAPAFGLPEAWTDKPASTAPMPESTQTSEAPPLDRGSLEISLLASAAVGIVNEGSAGWGIEAATVSLPAGTTEGQLLIGPGNRSPARPQPTHPDLYRTSHHTRNFKPSPNAAAPVVQGWTVEGMLQAFRTQYKDDAKAIRTLDYALKEKGFTVKIGSDLWWSKYYVDEAAKVISLADDWNFIPRSNESAAALMYEALSKNFWKHADLPETWELFLWRKPMAVLDVAGGFTAAPIGLGMTAAPEPVVTKVGGVAVLTYSFNAVYRGSTGFFNRDGGIDALQTAAGEVGYRLNGENGKNAAKTLVGLGELFAGGVAYFRALKQSAPSLASAASNVAATSGKTIKTGNGFHFWFPGKVVPTGVVDDALLRPLYLQLANDPKFQKALDTYNSIAKWFSWLGAKSAVGVSEVEDALKTNTTFALLKKLRLAAIYDNTQDIHPGPLRFWLQNVDPRTASGAEAGIHEMVHLAAMLNGQRGGGFLYYRLIVHENLVAYATTPKIFAMTVSAELAAGSVIVYTAWNLRDVFYYLAPTLVTPPRDFLLPPLLFPGSIGR